MAAALESTDVRNKLEDLSGIAVEAGQNPYEPLIAACDDEPAKIQKLYAKHRVTRNAQQKDKFLSRDFQGLIIDPYLLRLEDKTIEPGFRDPRNSLVYWARPSDYIVRLACHLQQKMREAAPNLWLMPPHRMHLTTLEVTHSRTLAEVDSLMSEMRSTLPALTSFTYTHRARLVKPMLSYDLAAIAVSFLPAAGEPSPFPALMQPVHISHKTKGSGEAEADTYTYHHLRRDVYELARSTGVPIDSRYVVPSAHITLARFLTQEDHDTPAKRQLWIQTIQDINTWLESQVWNQTDDQAAFVGEWIVGQERGLDARQGSLWYGGGRTIMTGEGF